MERNKWTLNHRINVNTLQFNVHFRVLKWCDGRCQIIIIKTSFAFQFWKAPLVGDLSLFIINSNKSRCIANGAFVSGMHGPIMSFAKFSPLNVVIVVSSYRITPTRNTLKSIWRYVSQRSLRLFVCQMWVAQLGIDTMRATKALYI